MSIVINTNMGVLSAQNSMYKAVNSLNNSLKRLATGYKINSAKDDAAGYYIATNINSQLRGLNVAKQNTQIAGNALNIAAGDLMSINDQLGRIRELTVQYSNSVYGDKEKEAIKAEIQQRVDEINRIAANSNFNGLNLLDGSADNLKLQVGDGSDPDSNSITITGVFGNANAEGINLLDGSAQYTTVDDALADADSAAKFIEDIDKASQDVLGRVAAAGAYGSRLDSVVDSINVKTENLSSAYSTIMDTDIAQETANVVKQQLLIQTSIAMITQANNIQKNAILSMISGI